MRRLVSVRRLMALSGAVIALGYPTGGKRAPGTGRHEEGDSCSYCHTGTLKADADGDLFCKRCGLAPADDD